MRLQAPVEQLFSEGVCQQRQMIWLSQRESIYLYLGVIRLQQLKIFMQVNF